MQAAINQNLIDKSIDDLYKNCQEKGDEYTKEQLRKFGAQAKKVVVENIRNQTLAYEAEIKMLPHLKEKHTQLTKSCDALEQATNEYQDALDANNKKIGELESKLKEHNQTHTKHQNALNASKTESKNHQQNSDRERVKKFGTLIDKNPTKHAKLVSLGEAICKLLGSPEAATPGALFKDEEKCKMLMNVYNPLDTPLQTSEECDKQIHDLRDFYTKESAPKEFKKTWKYGEIYNWAIQFCDTIKCSHALADSQKIVDDLEEQKQVLVDENEISQQLLDDLTIFELDNLKEQKEKIQTFIFRIEAKQQSGEGK